MSEILKNTITLVADNLEKIDWDIQRLNQSVYGIEPESSSGGTTYPSYDPESEEYHEEDKESELEQLDVLLERGSITQQEYDERLAEIKKDPEGSQQEYEDSQQRIKEFSEPSLTDYVLEKVADLSDESIEAIIESASSIEINDLRQELEERADAFKITVQKIKKLIPDPIDSDSEVMYAEELRDGLQGVYDFAVSITDDEEELDSQINSEESEMSIGSLKKKYDNKPFKLQSELEEEEEIANSQQFLEEALAELSQDKVDTSNKLLKRSILDDIKDIDTAYKKFLNKTQLKPLIVSALRCLAKQIPVEDLKNIICKRAVKKLVESLKISELASFFQDVSASLSLPKEVDQQLTQYLKKYNPSGAKAYKIHGKQKKEFVDFILKTLDLEKLCEKIFDKLPGLVTALANGIGSLIKEVNSIIPKPPKFRIPVILPTVDKLSPMSEDMKKKILKALGSAVVSSVVNLLAKLIDYACEDKEDGNIVDSLSDRALDGLGLTKEALKELQSALDDLSSLLSPRELCDLLLGRASQELYQIVIGLFETKYPLLLARFPTVSRISQLFNYLGSTMDMTECLRLYEADPRSSIDDDVYEVRKCLLRKDNVEQITQQIEILRKRKIDDFVDLLDLADKDDIFEELKPDYRSAMPFKYPQYREAMANSLNASASPVKTAFDNTMRNIIPALIDVVNKNIDAKSALNSKITW